MRLSTFIFIGLLFVTYSCNTKKLVVDNQQNVKELDQLHKLMTGTFSSKEQSIKDSSFYNINLVMYPIWQNDSESRWLYVEQAVTEYLKRPYRQRVYKITQVKNGLFESKVYQLPRPKRFIHAWEAPEIFSSISADSLIVRQGCAVYLKKDANNCYSGSTKEKACTSSLRGASYATSIVSVCGDEVVSWDQGWNDKDKQVWGAEKEGYIFKKK